jgi:hypothetical protein
VLGLEDSPDLTDVMGETLAPGVRRLPTASDLATDRAQLTTIADAGPADLAAVVPQSPFSAKGRDQDVAATLVSPFLLPFQTTATPSGNGTPTLAPLAWPLSPLLADGSQGSATTLPLAPWTQPSPTAILDQVFAAAAPKPPDQGVFSDPLATFGG